MKKIFTGFLCVIMTGLSMAQWSPTSMKDSRIRSNTNVTNYYTLDLDAIRAQLAKAPETGRNAKPIVVSLPTLEGKIEKFAVYSFPVVVKSLADRYQLGSYAGVGIDDPEKQVRFSTSPYDLQSMIIKNGEYEFIEPQNKERTIYGVHPKTAKIKSENGFFCSTNESPVAKAEIDKLLEHSNDFAITNTGKSSDKKYRTMRLAMSVTGEYTTYFGGVSQALSAINTTITRCNGIFEMDFGLHLILQDFPALIYTDATTDPYSNASAGSDGAWNTELQNTLTTVIGNDAYDIGHLFGASGGGGNAGCIGCVCVNDTASLTDQNKGSGFTSPADAIPMGDNFDIDYVAHEIGHQLGANHTYGYYLEGTGVNVEPGSGSTIMSYAGITSYDVQDHSDPYFHTVSITQVQSNLISKTCDIETVTTNTPPSITALTAYTIPKSTAFVLTAQATDAEGDPLTYCWEEIDNASSVVTSVTGNNTTGALFRSLLPTTSPTRYFPKLSSVLAGNLTIASDWETVSNVARTTRFRVTVRDNNADVTQKQTQFALQTITVGANGPFKVTSTQVYTNDSSLPFTWDVVGTTASPYNVANVKIDYTTDNGATWTVLTESTANDGSELLDFSALTHGQTIKVRVSAINNVFYAVGSVTVKTLVACDGTAPVGLAVSSVTSTQSDVTWEAVANATYIVRYKKLTDTTWTEVATSTNSYTITGLEEGFSYEVQIATVCTGTTGSYSSSINFVSLPSGYCTMTSSNSNSEYISNVTVTPTSGSTMSNDSAASKYTNYGSDYSKLINLVAGSTGNSISVTKSWAGAAYNESVTAWIDFNRDGSYDDSTEKVLATTGDKVTPVTATFSVPADAYVSGKVVGMRVALKYNTAPANACTNFNYGEVEDYAVLISENLATSETNKSTKVQVYPNPATDVLNITKVSANSNYMIFNMAGQVVAKGKVVDSKVQVNKLEKGVYFISIDDNGSVSKAKFIKQ